MTAFASNILAALSGAVAKPGSGGVGPAEGMGGGFEALLAGLIGEAAALVPATGGEKSGSNLPLLADTANDPDLTSQGQASAEALLAAAAPFATPAAPTPTPTDAAPRLEHTPVATAVANVIAAAVNAAVDAALPAPAEVAVDAVADVLAGALSREVSVEPADTVVAAPEKAPATAAAEPAAAKPAGPFAVATDEVFSVADRISPQAADKTPPRAHFIADAMAQAAPAVPVARADGPPAPAPVIAAAPTIEPEAVAVAPTSGRETAAPAAALAVTSPASPQTTARAVVEAAGPVVAKVVNPDAPVRAPGAPSTSAAAAAPTAPVAAPVEDVAVAVTAAAIAQAAEPQALPPETAAAIAATIAPATRPTAAPTDTRRTVKSAEVRTNLEADPVGPRSDKLAAKVAEVQSSIVDAALDAAPDAPLVAQVEPADADLAPQASAEGVAAEPALAAASPRHGETAPVVRGSPETVQKLAADIVQKLNGQNSKFDLQLDPLGLGKVDVRVEINADGRLTAALSFDSAAAAADLKGRSAELRQALQQAGFDVSDSGLSFDMAGQNPGFGGREAAGDQSRGQWSARAFQTAQAGLDDADARLTAALSNSSRTPSGGVDIRI